MNIVITGASSGIGKATALQLANSENHLYITGRRKEKLEDLQSQLLDKKCKQVTILNFDIRNAQEVEKHLGSIEAIDVLINNAGLALGLGTIDQGNWQHWDTMIDTNIKGLLYATRIVSEKMKKQGSGHIINVGSTAAKDVYLNGNVYCATKHAVDALSKSMRIDLLPHRIKVTCIHPGMVETEFAQVRFEGDMQKAKDVYKGIQPLEPNDVASVIKFAIKQPAHVCLNDIVMTCTSQANALHSYRQ